MLAARYYTEPSFIFNDRFDRCHVRIIYRFVVTTSVVGRYVGNDARHEQFFEILFERNWKSKVRMVNERIFRFFSFLGNPEGNGCVSAERI